MNHSYASGIICHLLVILAVCSSFLLVIIPVQALDLTPGMSQSSVPVISNGDPVSIHGVATGHPGNGLMVWVVGYNYLKISNIQPDSDNTYSFDLKSADTMNMASGQYLVIVQHPMMNGQFDITYDSSTGNVINRQLGGGTSIFQLGKSGSLQSTDAASALMRAIGSQNVDDTFATASFSISPPDAFINPVGTHAVGDKFTITGSTNLAVGDNLQVEVYSSSFKPTSKNQDSAFSGASGVVQVVPGTGSRNSWAFDIDSAGFRPDEYIVTVSGVTQDVSGSTTFTIVDAVPATPVTTVPVITATSVQAPVTTAVTESPVPTTKKSALFPGICLIAIIVPLIAIMRKKENI